MLQIVVGNNVKRETVVVSANTTLRTVLENAGVSYERGGVHLDGSTIQAGDLDKTFADFGIAERAYLLVITKADNAVR